MVEKALRPRGVFRDYDVDEKNLNSEMKEVFDCLVDSDQDYEAYEELEDDFVLLVNDGKPALELVEDENPDN